MVLLVEDAVITPEHDGHPSDGQSVSDDPLLSAGVLHVHGDRSGVRDIPEPTLVRGGRSRHVERLLNL